MNTSHPAFSAGVRVTTGGPGSIRRREFSLTALERSTVDGESPRTAGRADTLGQDGRSHDSFQLAGAQVGISINT